MFSDKNKWPIALAKNKLNRSVELFARIKEKKTQFCNLIVLYFMFAKV